LLFNPAAAEFRDPIFWGREERLEADRIFVDMEDLGREGLVRERLAEGLGRERLRPAEGEGRRPPPPPPRPRAEATSATERMTNVTAKARVVSFLIVLTPDLGVIVAGIRDQPLATIATRQNKRIKINTPR
jgi:hypothetical protein